MSFDIEKAREILSTMEVPSSWKDGKNVMEMWRALRDAINEIETLQYTISILDTMFIHNKYIKRDVCEQKRKWR